MSSRGGSSMNGKSSGGVAAGAISAIPAASRRMVHSLKEIVNCPEPEIYAMLKECNMDPNEAINRLLSQDPFHEVKSKREKKKENKDVTESRSRGGSSTSNRVTRGGSDRYVGRGGSNQFTSTESGVPHGKTGYKKENGLSVYSNYSSSASSMPGHIMNQQPSVFSEPVPPENKISTIGTGDAISSSSQPSSGYQPAWVGVPGQVSMADIVKMGRPHGKPSGTPNPSQHNVKNHHLLAPYAASYPDLHSSQDFASKASELNSASGVAMSLHVPPNDEWSLVEQPPPDSVSSVLESPADSELYADLSNLSTERNNQHVKPQSDEVRVTEDGAVENLNSNHVASSSVSSVQIQEDNCRGASLFDNDLYESVNSYQPQMHPFESQEVSSVAENIQQLSLQEDESAPSEEDNLSVKIPDHLQVQNADFSHLSFGSFGPSITAAFPGPSKCEEAPADASTVEHLDARSSEYYRDEHLITTSDGAIAHRNGASAGSYDPPSVSQPELLKQENPEVAQGNEFGFPSAVSGYTFENTQQLNPAFSHSHTSSQMQNHAPFSSVTAYTNSLPSTLLASTVQPVRESDLAYSPFPMTQSMPTKYNSTGSSVSGSTISMPEALRTGNFSSPQPTAQNLPGTSVATGPSLPQHLAVHPYSQPTLPLGHFANMIGYPFLPQSYTYLPSAFQQAFAGNSSYHQSLAAVLPQYKNSVSVSSLPQSAAVASGYGAFGSSTSIPGNFPLNPPSAPSGTTIGYDDIISSQYKDGNPLISLQQNENSAMWVHGPGSRTMSAVPASTYYSFQGQTQQPSGFRQGQQPSQHFGALGYPNFYHSQTGVSLEHQQQNPRDGSLGGAQSQQSKQSQQIWQNSY